MPDRILIKNAAQIIVTHDLGKPLTGEKLGMVETVEHASILITGGRIAEISSSIAVPQGTRIIDASGMTVMPGIVDSHTHVVYGGSRYEEFYLRAQGKSYLEIMKSGNGINRTVRDTEKMSSDLILKATLDRVRDAVTTGTTTMEMKTGYTSTLVGERKMLDVIDSIGRTGIVNAVPTFLGMHSIPPGTPEDAFVDYMINTVASRLKGRFSFTDAFCDSGAYSPESCRKLAEWSRVNGIPMKLHADELQDVGCLDLCNDYGFRSVDHLLQTGDDGIEKIRKCGSIANFLPITGFSLDRGRYPDIRKFIDAGIPVSLSSDISPLSVNSNVLFAMYLAIRFTGLSAEECLNAVTINGSYSAGVSGDRGSIEVGKSADLAIVSVDNYREIPYMYSSNIVDTVINGGKIVYRKGNIGNGVA
ncbi:MAG: imidazolonepropionase [Thermoplasmataceae archaeon]